MVCGILAHKIKKRAVQAALFLCSTLSMLDNRPEAQRIGIRALAGTFGRLWLRHYLRRTL
jgi:hypothetical protein